MNTMTTGFLERINGVRMRFLQILVFTIAFFITTSFYAQEQDSLKNKQKKVTITPLPVIAFNPTLGVVFGAMPGFSWYMGSPENTKISIGIGSFNYTTNQQFHSYFRANIFSSEDRWNVLSDIRYFSTSQPTFGLGTGKSSSNYLTEGSDSHYPSDPYSKIPVRQMMEFDFIRLHLTLFYRYENTRFYYGLGYHLDLFSNIQDNLLALDADPPRITHHYAYNSLLGFSTKKYTVSGLSLNGLYDTRDNTANPYSGYYALINWRISPKIIGSDSNSSQLWIEYRDYFSVSRVRPRNLIALWAYGSFITTGHVPYMNLPAVGWDMYARSGRAYTFGRFRGEDLVYLETEYRFALQQKKETLGGVLFVNGVSASSRTTAIALFQYTNWAAGFGLRIMMDKESRSNLTLDYGWGTDGSQGFFFGLNEAF